MSETERPVGRRGRTVATVTVRVTRQGEGRISTGEHVSFEGDRTFPYDARFEMATDAAQALQSRGLVEIQ